MNRHEYIRQAQSLGLLELIKLYKYHAAAKDDLLPAIRAVLDSRIESANEAELYRACQAEGISFPLSDNPEPPRAIHSPAPLPHPVFGLLSLVFPRKKTH